MGLFSRREPTQEDIIKLMKDAIGENELRRVRAAIDKGASVNMMGDFSPLYEAVKSNRVEIVKYLMEEGADPTLADKDNKTPAALATEIFNFGAQTYLLVTANDDTKAESTVFRTFSDFTDTQVIERAEVEFKRLGGKLPEGYGGLNKPKARLPGCGLG